MSETATAQRHTYIVKADPNARARLLTFTWEPTQLKSAIGAPPSPGWIHVGKRPDGSPMNKVLAAPDGHKDTAREAWEAFVAERTHRRLELTIEIETIGYDLDYAAAMLAKEQR